MFINFRKIIVFIITFVILISGTVSTANGENISDIKTGDYVQFGSYYGDPILWRVVNENADGSILLFSEKILCLKPFDAAESGKYGTTGGSRTADPFRQKAGSNNWENSNLREWLNSAEQTVSYSTQPPRKTTLVYGKNQSDYEPGFLTNFTLDEIAAIQPVLHKCILASIDSGKRDGGSQELDYEYDLSHMVENYDMAYYKNVTDKVFLLDEKEIREYVYDRGYNAIKISTAKAGKYAEGIGESSFRPEADWYYWLRSPEAQNSQLVRHVSYKGYIECHEADYMAGGVVPALNLKASAIISGGKGTLESPYTFPYGKVPAQGTIPTRAADLAATIKIMIDGKQLKTDIAPYTASGKVIVPFKAIFEALGAVVIWEDNSETAIGYKGRTCIALQPENIYAVVYTIKPGFKGAITIQNLYKAVESPKTLTMDTPPTLKNKQLMVPVSFVAKSLGVKADWNGKTSTVTITTQPGK